MQSSDANYSAASSTPATTLTMTLQNNTGLSADSFTIYVLGFTPTSQKMLYIADPARSKTASFVKISLNEGTLPAYKLGDQITEVQVNIPASFSDTDKIDGARIYFFVADNSKFSAAPTITYTHSPDGKTLLVVNVLNPPNNAVPPYSFCEFTIVDPAYGPVIDVQTVDGFTLPVTITLNQGGAVGQSFSISRYLFRLKIQQNVHAAPLWGRHTALHTMKTPALRHRLRKDNRKSPLNSIRFHKEQAA